jgi:hypothetical protein
MGTRDELRANYGFDISTVDPTAAETLLNSPIQFSDYETVTSFDSVDPYRLQLSDHLLQLLIKTHEFRSRAYSYRNFWVAAGALAVGDRTYGRFLGINVKADGGDRVNIHAEDIVHNKVERSGLPHIVIFVAIGDQQYDEHSGRSPSTLHFCGARCLPSLQASSLISKNTLFVTARPDFTVIEYGSIAAYQAYSMHGDSSGLSKVEFDQTPAVFAPLPQPNADGTYHLSELEEVDDRDWNEAMTLPLMRRYTKLTANNRCWE